LSFHSKQHATSISPAFRKLLHGLILFVAFSLTTITEFNTQMIDSFCFEFLLTRINVLADRDRFSRLFACVSAPDAHCCDLTPFLAALILNLACKTKSQFTTLFFLLEGPTCVTSQSSSEFLGKTMHNGLSVVLFIQLLGHLQGCK